jgi:hypothetical protein
MSRHVWPPFAVRMSCVAWRCRSLSRTGFRHAPSAYAASGHMTFCAKPLPGPNLSPLGLSEQPSAWQSSAHSAADADTTRAHRHWPPRPHAGGSARAERVAKPLVLLDVDLSARQHRRSLAHSAAAEKAGRAAGWASPRPPRGRIPVHASHLASVEGGQHPCHPRFRSALPPHGQRPLQTTPNLDGLSGAASAPGAECPHDRPDQRWGQG